MKLSIKFPREPITIGPETEELYRFYCTTLNFERKLPKRALCTGRRPLRRDYRVT